MGGQPEDVVCRASVNCAGGPGDDLGNTTERECCVNNPSSRAYVDSKGNCIPCVGEHKHNTYTVKRRYLYLIGFWLL